MKIVMPNKIDFQQTGVLMVLCLLAAVAMLLPLPVMEYVGEESYYTLSAIEMHITGNYWHHLIFGMQWPKTPMFHWLILAVCQIIGIEHVDIAARLVSVMASWAAALVAGLWAAKLYPQHAHAGWLAALIYLSMGEITFWYGWLGYADATFAAFVFSSIWALWRAVKNARLGWFATSLVLISCAYMTKNISAYAMYGLAGVVLFQRCSRWRLLMHPSFVVLGLAALAVPWLYQSFHQSESNSMVAIRDALRNFTGFGITTFLWHWLSYPAVFIFRALPLSLFFLFLWLSRKQSFSVSGDMRTVGMILLGCLFPFWLSAAGSPRYLVPLYGFAALLLTGWLIQLDRRWFTIAMRLLVFILIVKIPYSLAVLPYIKDWRHDRSLQVVAEDILEKTQGKPVKTTNDIASGLSIAAYMDVRLPPARYIRWYRGEHGVFVMAEAPDAALGQLVKNYPIRGRHMYLYWKP